MLPSGHHQYVWYVLMHELLWMLILHHADPLSIESYFPVACQLLLYIILLSSCMSSSPPILCTPCTHEGRWDCVGLYSCGHFPKQ